MNWLAFGALGCAVSIGMGAFGAHGLRGRLDSDALALWETASRYLMYSSLALMALALHARQSGIGAGWTALVLACGALVFSGTVAVLALGGPRWLGAITPIGGVMMIVALVAFAWSTFHS